MNVMKANINIIFIFCCTITFSSCWHSDLADTHRGGGEIAFFQFTDSTLVNKVLLEIDGRDRTVPEDYYYSWRENLCIPLYPRNVEGMPLFGEKADGTNFIHDWKIGEKYTLEDLVNTPKFIALKDGYYICWPFVQLEKYGYYTNVEWKDLLTMNIDTVHAFTAEPYINRYVIHEDELVKLTQKSTKHFHGRKRDEITIDDVVKVLNDLIETGTIEDHCFQAARSFY